MISKEFKYNPDAHYSNTFSKKVIDIINQNIVITSNGKGFKA